MYDVLLIGGGPSSCSLAIMLRKYGYKVLILEKKSFPKHALGESLLPIVTSNYMKIIGLDEKLKDMKFPKKYAVTFIYGKNRKPWTFFFDSRLDIDKTKYNKEEIKEIISGDYEHAYQVNRYYFDKLFVDKAIKDGVIFKENIAIKDIYYDNNNDIKGVILKNGDIIKAKFIVDGSGQESFIGSRLGLRKFNTELGFSAVYGYFKNFTFPFKFISQNTQYIISIDIGWIWFIYIGKGIVSIGLVSSRKNIKNNEFFEILNSTKELKGVFNKNTEFIDSLGNKIKKPYRARNRSFFSERLYGKNFLLIGDSAGFVDPILSGGVSLALMSGILAAPYINNYLKKGNIDIFKKYQDKIFYDVNNYYELAKYWYGNNKSTDSWFWKANNILGLDINNKYNKRAFSYIASGKIYSEDNLNLLNNLRIDKFTLNNEDIVESSYLGVNNKVFYFKVKKNLISLNSDISQIEYNKKIKDIVKIFVILLSKIKNIDIEIYNILIFLYKNTNKILLFKFFFSEEMYNLIDILLNFNNSNEEKNLIKNQLFGYVLYLRNKNYFMINNIKFSIRLNKNIRLFNNIEINFINNLENLIHIEFIKNFIFIEGKKIKKEEKIYKIIYEKIL